MNMKLKIRMLVGIIVCLMGLAACKSNIKIEQDNYLYCNKTSNGTMAETEEGYFLVVNQMLYYADKNNLEQWVVVCNKPDCKHENNMCNGYLSSTSFWQNNGKFYEVEFGETYEKPYIYEIGTDGSGLKKVYEIPMDINPTGFAKATFQDEFLIRYGYLDEDGIYKAHLISLEEDEKGNVKISELYKQEETFFLLSGNVYWSMRGDNLFITSLYLEEGGVALNNLCRIKDGEIEPLNLPDDVNFSRGYVNDDILISYKPQEGFYQYNINTGENELLYGNELENAVGYVLSADYMVECNRYINYMPEEAHLRVYNKGEWIEVDLPEEIANCDAPFYPECIASDRIFFRMNLTGDDSLVTTYMYYMMLEEENPKLVYAGKIGDEIVDEPVTEQESETDDDGVYANFEEVTVFETEDYLFKVTDIYLDYSNRCCVEMYFENRSEDKNYSIHGNHWSINGIHCATDWGESVYANNTKTFIVCLRDGVDQMIGESKISDFYNADEYTNIKIGFYLACGSEYIEENFVSLYPQGKEQSITFTREPQETDQILVNNDQVSITITGYEKYFVPGDTINVLIENKTEELIAVKVEEATANGITVESFPHYGVYYVIVNPGTVAMYPMALFDGRMDGWGRGEPMDTFFTTNNITSIEEIEMKLKISKYIYGEGEKEEFVNAIFVLNP